MLQTKDEETEFLQLIGSNEIFPNNGNLPYFIGGIKYGNNWVWTKTLTKISYKIKWSPGEPSSKGVENCLSVIKRDTDDAGINDTLCETFVTGFFCQKVIKDFEEEHKIVCLID